MANVAPSIHYGIKLFLFSQVTRSNDQCLENTFDDLNKSMASFVKPTVPIVYTHHTSDKTRVT